MTFPTAYTEDSLAAFMHSTLGKVASVLGYSSPTSYEEAVYATLFRYGTEDITSISGRESLHKLRVLAKVQAWEKAVSDLAALFGYSADGGSYKRNEMYVSAKKNLDAAQTDALAYDPIYSAQIRKTDYIHDPYKVRDADERPL